MKPRKRQPQTSPVDHPSGTPCCQWDTVGLIAAALVGICGLIQFGYFVAENDAEHQGVGGDVIIRAEIRALYASQALVDFCKNHDLSAIGSREELMCLLECEGLEKIWYGNTVRLFQANGQSRDSSGVGSLAEPGFRHTLAVLQTLAGRPSPNCDDGLPLRQDRHHPAATRERKASGGVRTIADASCQ